MKNITQAVKNESRRQGFTLVGVTTPDPPPHLDFFNTWLEAGYHGDMGWMATERNLKRRSDPREILPDCQSILSLGIPYPFPETADGRGSISSYAWNKDYHLVLEPRLENIIRFLKKEAGEHVHGLWYTDTGPILEREIASRAGLGWIGKNTTLINPQKGSFFFLAEILLNIPLVPDAPFQEEHCGSCTRCLEACPTGCLVAPYTLDANRCLSYLTIEYRDYIPRSLRSTLGEWIFGCDICQQVCPWNQRFGKDSEIMDDFAPREDIVHPELTAEVGLTAREFNHKFKESPIKRTKRRGYLRNVVLALGNQGLEAALPALHAALGDREPLVRGHAAWSLGRIGGKRAKKLLLSAADREEDPRVKTEIKQALEALSGQ